MIKYSVACVVGEDRQLSPGDILTVEAPAEYSTSVPSAQTQNQRGLHFTFISYGSVEGALVQPRQLPDLGSDADVVGGPLIERNIRSIAMSHGGGALRAPVPLDHDVVSPGIVPRNAARPAADLQSGADVDDLFARTGFQGDASHAPGPDDV